MSMHRQFLVKRDGTIWSITNESWRNATEALFWYALLWKIGADGPGITPWGYRTNSEQWEQL